MENIKNIILTQAKEQQDKLVAHRRQLHENPELHLDLPLTKAYVVNELQQMGYEIQECGSSGIIVLAGKKPGKCFMLRADMDALPIHEETDVDYKSKIDGVMHACGHDMHTAMLLGAAKILKDNEDLIEGTIKLMFQPAEETLSGAKDMIEHGVLENPKVDAAMMIHVASGVPFVTGSALIANPGIGSAAADWFDINIQGKGSHGAMPEMGVDPLNVAAHIHIALQAINSRETAGSDCAILTIGQMSGGFTSNVLPDTAQMHGTLRTFDESVREFTKKRMVEICDFTAKAFRASATVNFYRGCPTLKNNKEVTDFLDTYLSEIFDKEHVIHARDFAMLSKMSGSEDFAYVSDLTPSTMITLFAGSPKDGYDFSLHHPKVKFDEEALWRGSAIYAYSAIRWTMDNKN